MENPLVNKFVNDRIRPISEDARSLFARGIDAKQMLNNLVPILIAGGFVQLNQDGTLTALTPDEVINDGRESQGIYQLTIGDFVYMMNHLNTIINMIDNDNTFKTLLVKASIRSL